ncbi:hypothetical protein [Streptomyces sp. NPDC090022]|uniref:hypothetical protein n=1 Tax=Streptomyces sp. NPDC090022 TaxID=3365920 RepID=UPI00382CB48E
MDLRLDPLPGQWTARHARPDPLRHGPAAVAAAYTLLQLLLVVPGTGLGWDETVYVSQVDPHAPAAFFSAPRARGITFLVAPVTWWTADPTVLHASLALMSGAALLLCLRVWRPLLPASVLTAAAALFTGLWITLLYGPQAMPNLWVAYGVLAAVGCFLRAATAPTPARARWPLCGLAAALCAVALLRPSDALWLAGALTAAAALVRPWRRPVLLLAVAAGAALGAAEWIVEAEWRYGGTAARLRRAAEIQGGLEWRPALADQVRGLEGRTLCRPCAGVPWRRPVTALWWFLVPPAVAAGLWAAVRGRRQAGWERRPRGGGPPTDASAGSAHMAAGSAHAAAVAGSVTEADAGPAASARVHMTWADRPAAVPALVLATAAATALALPYLLFLGYAAPRFLLPSYALLALPAGAGLVALVQRIRSDGWNRAAARLPLALLAVVLAGHFAVQYAVLHAVVTRVRANHVAFTAVAKELTAQGVRPPCVVSGHEAVRVAFRLGCSSRQTGGHDASVTAAELVRTARDRPVVVLTAGDRPVPAHARGWRPVRLPDLPGVTNYRAYLSW